MNRYELKALRNLFHLSVKEAAEHVGHVSARTWNYWENGTYNIPGDVVEGMNQIKLDRLARITAVEDESREHDLDVIISWYDTYKAYQSEHEDAAYVQWRLSQSVGAYFLGEDICSLV